jgi:hypothetical protein
VLFGGACLLHGLITLLDHSRYVLLVLLQQCIGSTVPHSTGVSVPLAQGHPSHSSTWDMPWGGNASTSPNKVPHYCVNANDVAAKSQLSVPCLGLRSVPANHGAAAMS